MSGNTYMKRTKLGVLGVKTKFEPQPKRREFIVDGGDYFIFFTGELMPNKTYWYHITGFKSKSIKTKPRTQKKK